MISSKKRKLEKLIKETDIYYFNKQLKNEDIKDKKLHKIMAMNEEEELEEEDNLQFEDKFGDVYGNNYFFMIKLWVIFRG